MKSFRLYLGGLRSKIMAVLAVVFVTLILVSIASHHFSSAPPTETREKIERAIKLIDAHHAKEGHLPSADEFDRIELKHNLSVQDYKMENDVYQVYCWDGDYMWEYSSADQEYHRIR